MLSRVQRFDFRRVSVTDLVCRLEAVLAAEGIAADSDALLPIARRAEGGVRDALSLLDQVISQGFAYPSLGEFVTWADTPNAAIEALRAAQS